MKASITVKRKKRGRPATGTDPLVGVRFPQTLIDTIDAWGAAHEQPLTRSHAIPRLPVPTRKLLRPLSKETTRRQFASRARWLSEEMDRHKPRSAPCTRLG